MPDLTTKTTLPLQDFVSRWQGSTLTERSAVQSHFHALCQALDYKTPTEADQDGTWYAFERDDYLEDRTNCLNGRGMYIEPIHGEDSTTWCGRLARP